MITFWVFSDWKGKKASADALAQMDPWMCLGTQQLHAGSSPHTHSLIFFEVRGIHLLYSCFTHQIIKVILKYFD